MKTTLIQWLNGQKQGIKTVTYIYSAQNVKNVMDVFTDIFAFHVCYYQ